MSTAPSTALRVLASCLREIPADEPLTAGRLAELVDEAAEGTASSEYDDYMGEDL